MADRGLQLCAFAENFFRQGRADDADVASMAYARERSGIECRCDFERGRAWSGYASHRALKGQ